MAIIWKTFTNIKQLVLIQTEWDKLNQEHNSGCFFTSPKWLLNWVDIYWQDNWHIYSFAAYDGNELIALLPFYYQQNSKFLTQKNLFFIGQGEPEQAEVSSEYLDILINDNYSKPLLSYCRERLSHKEFDTFFVRATTATANVLKAMDTTHHKLSGTQYQLSPEHWKIELLSKNTRSKIKRTTKLLTSNNAQFTWVANEDKLSYWEKMSQFHQKRWLKKNCTGAFSQDEFHNFHRNLIDNSTNTAMSVLTINNQVIAINYYLKDNDNYYFYQSGWDEEKFKHFSPGFALHVWSIKNCDASKYDFMMGSLNDSYKSKFNCEKHALYEISVHYKPIKHVLLKLLQKIFTN